MIRSRISKDEEEYIIRGADVNVRGDGRRRMDYRSISVESGVFPHVHGSAHVVISHKGTDVVASVKIEVGEPEPNFPDLGKFEVDVCCSPHLFPRFDDRDAQDVNAAIASTLQNVLGGSGTATFAGGSGSGGSFDLSKLCIIPGRYCWVVYLDLLVTAADGSLYDACSFASYLALQTAKLPSFVVLPGEGGAEDDFEISPDLGDATPLPLLNVPIFLTYHRIGARFIVDATREEEACSTAQVVVAFTPSGQVRGLFKHGGGSFQPHDLTRAIAVGATATAPSIFRTLDLVTARMDARDRSRPDQPPSGRAGYLL